VKNLQQIRNYYKKTLWDYKRGWDGGEFIHYGYWDKDTKDNREALRRMVDKVVELADIKPRDLVLDAGCGTGGTARYISQKYGAKVIGVTIVPEQLQFTSQDTTTFIISDFHRLPFKDETFDKVIAIESFCYSNPPLFMLEINRVLKKGGKLVIADGFLAKEEHRENILYKIWKKGWAVYNLTTIEETEALSNWAKFKVIHSEDITKNVEKSSWIMFLRTLPFPFALLLGWTRFRNIFSGFIQYFLVKLRILVYGVVLLKAKQGRARIKS